MHLREICRAVLVLPFFLAASLWSQSDAPWDALRTATPPGVSASLRLLDAGPFPAGSLLRAEYRFDFGDTSPGSGTRPANWVGPGYLLDPPLTFPEDRNRPCGTVERACSNPFPILTQSSGGRSGERDSAEVPVVYLAENLPPLPPGRYRVAVMMHEYVPRRIGSPAPGGGQPDPHLYAITNTVELEIVPATEQWVRETVDDAVRILRNGESPRRAADSEARKRAAKQIVHIDHPYAWNAALSLMGADGSELRWAGPLRSKRPAELCEFLQERLPDAGQTVDFSFLDALVRSCVIARVAPPPVFEPTPHGQPLSPAELSAREYWRRRNELGEQFKQEALETLARTLPRRSGRSRYELLNLLIGQVRSWSTTVAGKPAPPWFETLYAEFARVYPSLELIERRRLLPDFVQAWPTPAAIPVLETEMASWAPGSSEEFPNTAFRFLASLDLPRAREIIAAELRKPRTWMGARALEYIPATEAPFTDEQLLDALRLARDNDGSGEAFRSAAIARFASPAAADRIRKLYQDDASRCQPELLAYFLRTDPDFASTILRSQASGMQEEPPRCWLQIVQRTPELASSPDLEQYIGSYLAHRIVWVRRATVEALKMHGSPNAKGVLLEAFRRFHQEWHGRPQELELQQNYQELDFESRLAWAILSGQHWFSDAAEIRAVMQLCVSPFCEQTIGGVLARATKAPLPVSFAQTVDGIFGEIAQYGSGRGATPDRFFEKLRQFPKGTSVRLKVDGLQRNEWDRKLRNLLAETGLTVLPQ